MRRDRPNTLGGLVGVACAGIFAFHAFTFDVDAETSVHGGQEIQMPTARDLTIYERRLRKATRESRFAESCGRGQLIGNAEVVVAMHFPPVDRPATTEAPGLARAHVENVEGTPKAVVLESKDPTLWSVTGSPDAIILLGEAVIADFPEGTPVFAPRFAETCGASQWAHPPKNWTLPQQQTAMNALVDDVYDRLDKRAQFVADRLFDRPAADWRVERGSGVMSF